MAFAFSDLQTGLPLGLPRGSLSLTGGIPGFHVPLQKSAGLGACCQPGGFLVTRAQKRMTLPASNPVWVKRFNPFRLAYMTIFIADSDPFTVPAI
jgi:hypothetical protein